MSTKKGGTFPEEAREVIERYQRLKDMYERDVKTNTLAALVQELEEWCYENFGNDENPRCPKAARHMPKHDPSVKAVKPGEQETAEQREKRLATATSRNPLIQRYKKEGAFPEEARELIERYQRLEEMYMSDVQRKKRKSHISGQTLGQATYDAPTADCVKMAGVIYDKIPTNLITVINENQNEDYNYQMNDELDLNNQPMLPETKAILFNIFRDYLSTPEQKEKIIRMQKEDMLKLRKKKSEEFEKSFEKQYSLNNEIVENKEENEETTALVKVEEKSIWHKFLNKIRNKFKR